MPSQCPHELRALQVSTTLVLTGLHLQCETGSFSAGAAFRQYKLVFEMQRGSTLQHLVCNVQAAGIYCYHAECCFRSPNPEGGSAWPLCHQFNRSCASTQSGMASWILTPHTVAWSANRQATIMQSMYPMQSDLMQSIPCKSRVGVLDNERCAVRDVQTLSLRVHSCCLRQSQVLFCRRHKRVPAGRLKLTANHSSSRVQRLRRPYSATPLLQSSCGSCLTAQNLVQRLN